MKTINANERDWIYQTDTGPHLLPDLSRARPTICCGGMRLAFSAFNVPDWIEFIVRVPTRRHRRHLGLALLASRCAATCTTRCSGSPDRRQRTSTPGTRARHAPSRHRRRRRSRRQRPASSSCLRSVQEPAAARHRVRGERHAVHRAGDAHLPETADTVATSGGSAATVTARDPASTARCAIEIGPCRPWAAFCAQRATLPTGQDESTCASSTASSIRPATPRQPSATTSASHTASRRSSASSLRARTFLPVFVARLGGSNLQVSLITALPSLTGVILAIPLGGLIQSRRNIIPWYSRGRLGSQLGYVVDRASWRSLLPAAAGRAGDPRRSGGRDDVLDGHQRVLRGGHGRNGRATAVGTSS